MPSDSTGRGQPCPGRGPCAKRCCLPVRLFAEEPRHPVRHLPHSSAEGPGPARTAGSCAALGAACPPLVLSTHPLARAAPRLTALPAGLAALWACLPNPTPAPGAGAASCSPLPWPTPWLHRLRQATSRLTSWFGHLLPILIAASPPSRNPPPRLSGLASSPLAASRPCASDHSDSPSHAPHQTKHQEWPTCCPPPQDCTPVPRPRGFLSRQASPQLVLLLSPGLSFFLAGS